MKPDLIFIRHGLFSDSQKISELEKNFHVVYPNARIDNSNYKDNEHILLNGIYLAKYICENSYNANNIILVGHSMGGLISRVAAATIFDLTNLKLGMARRLDIRVNKTINDEIRKLEKSKEFKQFNKNRIKGLVLLATPNNGALTLGQLSLFGTFYKKLGKIIKRHSVNDLITIGLFKILQNVRIESLKYMSISGSFCNIYTPRRRIRWYHCLCFFKCGMFTDLLPNDTIVEDASVDLQQGTLPCEIIDFTNQYTHLRQYKDCDAIHHFNIYKEREIISLIQNEISEW